GDLSRTLPPPSRAGPGEERHDAARRAHLVAVVQMVALRIVEVHRPLHEAQTEQPRVEIEIALRVTRYGADVVEAENPGHAKASPLVVRLQSSAYRERGRA